MSVENEISYDIRGAAFLVYKELGPGLLESIYEKAMELELLEMGYDVKSQVEIDVRYKDVDLGLGLKLDLLVDDLVLIELKSVKDLEKVHHKQLMTYLRLTGKKLGLLINFNSHPLQIVRIVNGL